MAGTMPHAIFVETGLDDGATVAAYAAELPGCAVFAATDVEATAGMPRRVAQFTDWLRTAGEPTPEFVGDNWYEVERAAALRGPDGLRRAGSSLDDLPPSREELAAYRVWLELGREELAVALDHAPRALPPEVQEAMEAIVRQDVVSASALGGAGTGPAGNPVDRLYAAREALTTTLEQAGPGVDGIRRVVRLAIADDLRLAERLMGA